MGEMDDGVGDGGDEVLGASACGGVGGRCTTDEEADV